MSIKTIAAALAIATLSVSSAAMTAPAASAKGVVVRTSGSCTARTDWKLKAKADDGRLEVEFEVDSNRNGQKWTVKLYDNGTKVWSGKRTTQAPSGSFSVEKKITNQSGTDAIKAVAKNARTGETCTGTLRFAG